MKETKTQEQLDQENQAIMAMNGMSNTRYRSNMLGVSVGWIGMILTVIVLLMGQCQTALAQTMYEVQYKNQADLLVYEVQYPEQADIRYWIAPYQSQANDTRTIGGGYSMSPKPTTPYTG